jgi:hypothetical protein
MLHTHLSFWAGTMGQLVADVQNGLSRTTPRIETPRTSVIKDENGDLLADSHNILNRWKN